MSERPIVGDQHSSESLLLFLRKESGRNTKMAKGTI